MEDLLFELADDLTRYLNMDQSTELLTVSTSTFFVGLYNLKNYRFIPIDNGIDILEHLQYLDVFKSSEIKASSNVNIMNDQSKTALYFAVLSNNIEAAKLLIDFNANVNLSTTEIPLMMAILNNNIEMVRLLINSNVDVNHGDGDSTPLHYAIIVGNIEIIKMLINSGANVNAVNFYGKTLLHEAIKKGNIEIIELLEQAGARLE